MQQSQGARRSAAARGSAVLLVAVAAMLVAGCQHDEGPPLGLETSDARLRHPIIVEARPYALELAVAGDDSALAPAQLDDARRFLRRFRTQGKGTLDIAAGPDLAGSGAMADLGMLLKLEGIDRRAVRLGRRTDATGTIDLAFETGYVAQAPECGYWPENLARQKDNGHYWNFGCASQRNVALMVANPEDLVRMRRMGPRASERRDVIWQGYVEGAAPEKTSDPADLAATASTSSGQ